MEIRNHSVSILLLLLICFSSTLLLRPVIVSGQEYLGRDQLVDALDAAIARVLDSGQYRTILNSDSPASSLWVNIADCYPRITEDDPPIDIYPFPENPTGLLADIIASKTIRVGVYATGGTPGTFHIWDIVNPLLLRAIIDELGKGYGLDPVTDPIVIQEVEVWPPSSGLFFNKLNNGDFDITDFLGALGATANNKRRRKQARFTCTIYGTPWYIHVRNDSSYTTFDDVYSDTTARLCVGMLSSRLSEDYFKNARGKRCVPTGGSCTVHADCSTGEICTGSECAVNNNFGDPCTVHADCSTGETCRPWITKIFAEDDLTECSGGVSDETYDAYLHFDPVPVSYPDPNDLRSIPMQITSGIPIWVAGDQDQDDDGLCHMFESHLLKCMEIKAAGGNYKEIAADFLTCQAHHGNQGACDADPLCSWDDPKCLACIPFSDTTFDGNVNAWDFGVLKYGWNRAQFPCVP